MTTTRLLLGSALLCLVIPALGAASAGLKADITTVNIAADRRPVATVRISDANGKPLEVEDLDAGSIKFTIAKIQNAKTGETEYYNYILTKVVGKNYIYKGETKNPALAETLQPGFDEGGISARVRPGVFTYTFKQALPSDYDKKATHVIGGELTGKGKICRQSALRVRSHRHESKGPARRNRNRFVQ